MVQTKQVVNRNLKINMCSGIVCKKLREELRRLKAQPNLSIDEVKFVSNKLRKPLGNKMSTQTTTTKGLEHSMRKNAWKSCKKLFASTVNTIPNFDVPKCMEYFQKVLRPSNKTRTFQIPSWVPALPLPQ